MQMLMLVLYDPGQVEAVLEGWRDVGLVRVRVVEGYCLTGAPHRHVGARHLFGMMGGVGCGEECAVALFAVVPGDESVSRCLAATEAALGGLDDTRNGYLVTWELSHSKGIAGGAAARGDGS